MNCPPRILISAGEASGDRLGAGLARALHARRPELELYGMGGPRMEEAGVHLLQQASEVSVVGIWEVLARLPAIRRAMTRLSGFLVDRRPDLLVAVDFPDFNLRLAARARRAGVEVVYFVSPQIWAWRRGRLGRIRRLVRRMLVLFPFETALYEAAGVPVTFVGHPAAEPSERPRSREDLCRVAGLDPQRDVIALAPGSRRGEVERLLGPLLLAARRVQQRHPRMQFLVPVAPGLDPRWIEREVEAGRLDSVRTHCGDFPDVLRVCRAGVVASGTASLEAAVAGLPIVVVYRMNPLSYAVGRALVRLDHIALPNLVAGRRIVPELVQGRCTPEQISAALLRYLDEPGWREQVLRDLREVPGKLGGPGVFERAADQLLSELGATGSAR